MSFIKLFKVIFIALFLVTCVELGYYLYIQTTGVSISPAKTQRIVSYSSDVLACSENPPQEIVDKQALSESALRSLRYLKKGLISSSTTTSELRGKIVQIEKKEGISSLGTQYERLLKISGSNGHVNTFELKAEKMNNVEVYQDKEGKKEKINFDNLYINDKIVIDITHDLLKSTNDWLIKMIIIKS